MHKCATERMTDGCCNILQTYLCEPQSSTMSRTLNEKFQVQSPVVSGGYEDNRVFLEVRSKVCDWIALGGAPP